MRAAIPSLAALAALLLTACAGSSARGTTRQTDVRVADQADRAAATTVITNESSVSSSFFQAPADRVWTALLEVWQELELTANIYEPDRMRIGNEAMPAVRIAGERMAHWVDCGSGMTGPNANRFDVVVTLFTTVAPESSSSTELRMDVDAQGKPRDYSGNWMHCSSQGTLEELIAEMVQARL